MSNELRDALSVFLQHEFEECRCQFTRFSSGSNCQELFLLVFGKHGIIYGKPKLRYFHVTVSQCLHLSIYTVSKFGFGTCLEQRPGIPYRY